jgi:hypothetical protein
VLICLENTGIYNPLLVAFLQSLQAFVWVENVLEFKIIYKNPQLYLEFKELNTDFYKRLTDKFKLSAWQANLLAEHIPAKEIHSNEIQPRNANGESKNIGRFTAHTFENKYKLGLLSQNLNEKPM